MEKTNKQCPYCGEEILAIAKKCRYCGEWLTENSAPIIQPRVSATTSEEVLSEESQSEVFSPTMLDVSQEGEIINDKTVARKSAEEKDNAFRKSCFYNYFIGGIKRSFQFKGTATRRELFFLLLYSVLIVVFFVGCWLMSVDPDSAYDDVFGGESNSINGLSISFFGIMTIVSGVYMIIPIMACCCRRAGVVGMKEWKGIVCLPIAILIIWLVVRDGFYIFEANKWNVSKLTNYIYLVMMLFGLAMFSIIPFVQMMKRVEEDDKVVTKFNYIDIIYIVLVLGAIVWGIVNLRDWIYEVDRAARDYKKLLHSLEELNDVFD